MRQPTPTIAGRLLAPARRLTLGELASSWYQTAVSARVPGYAALAHDLDLLRRQRGASRRQEPHRTHMHRDRRTVVVEGAGHWLHHDQFEPFIASLQAFLRSGT